MPSLNRLDSMLLVVDMQARLLPAISGRDRLLGRAEVLLRGASLLDVPVAATEHCADKIGPTTPVLQPWIENTLAKTHFDATREVEFPRFLPVARPTVLLIGTEAHVCVLQTALGLQMRGLRPVVVADAIGSRHAADRELALGRCALHQIEVVSSEMVLFEWLESAQHPQFKAVLALITSL